MPEAISNLLEEQGMVLASGYTSGDLFQTTSKEQHFAKVWCKAGKPCLGGACCAVGRRNSRGVFLASQ